MKKVYLKGLVAVLFMFGGSSVFAQTTNIWGSFAILNIKDSANQYYDLSSATANPDFQGANLGTFWNCQTLIVQGGQTKTNKCSGGNVISANINYRVWLTSSGASGSFNAIGQTHLSDDGGSCGGDQTWQGTGGAVNVLSGLPPGNYTLEVYVDAPGSPGTAYASNGGSNYKATFTVVNSGALLPGNYPIPGCFATVNAAVTYLNANGVTGTGAVQFNCAAGGSETAPAGGISLAATGTSNTAIKFKALGTYTITAPAQSSGILTDAIIKLNSSSYVTFDGFTLNENAANTTTVAGTNNKTEFGFALMDSTLNVGCQHNNILNCKINLGSTAYQNSFGIYNECSHSPSVITSAKAATTTAGTNSYNQYINNTISGVQYGIYFVQPAASAATLVEQGNRVINNLITIQSSNVASSSYNGMSVTAHCGGILSRSGFFNFTALQNRITQTGAITVIGTGIGTSANSANAPTGVFSSLDSISNNYVSLNQTGAATTFGIQTSLSTSTTANVTSTIIAQFDTVIIATTGNAALYAGISGMELLVGPNYASSILATNDSINIVASTTNVSPEVGAVIGLNLTGICTNPTARANKINITRSQSTGSNSANMNAILIGGAAGSGTSTIQSNYIWIQETGTTVPSGFVNIIFANNTGNTLLIDNNTITTGAGTLSVTGASNCINYVLFANGITISNNTITVAKSGTATSFYGIATSTAQTTTNENIVNNNISLTGFSGAAIPSGINLTATSVNNVKRIISNTVLVSGTHTGTTQGINSIGGLDTITNNKVYVSSANPTTATQGIALNPSVINASINSIANNNIVVVGTGATVNLIGISCGNTGRTNILNNVIDSMYATQGASSTNNITGIIRSSVGALTDTIGGNTIRNLFTASGTGACSITGIKIAAASGLNIIGNNIYSLSSPSSAAASFVYGINFTGGTASTTYNIYNNLISNLTLPNASRNFGIVGINAGFATNSYKVYYNTIKLNPTFSGTSGGAIGVAFINTASGTPLDLRNNIININGTSKGTAISSCVLAQTAATGTTTNSILGFASTSNNNIYYITPGLGNYYFVQSNTDTTAIKNGFGPVGINTNSTNNVNSDNGFNTPCSVYKSFMLGLSSTCEASSNVENNLYSVTPPAVGGFAPSGTSFAENGAQTITTPNITTDFNGTTRTAGTNNDRGAIQFAGTSAGSDNIAPTISYAALPSSTTSLCAPSLSATITDASLVTIAPGVKPRLWYKKSTDADNVFVGNTSAQDGWKYVEASNSTSPFTFTMDYSKLQSAVSAGDSISYFVVAQDSVLVPNVAHVTVNFGAGVCPTSVALTDIGVFPTTGANGIKILATPTAATTVASPTGVCTSGKVGLSLTPNAGSLVGLRYQWMVSTDNFVSSNSIVGIGDTLATDSTALLTAPSTTYYRCVIKDCSGATLFTSSIATITANSPPTVTISPATIAGCGAFGTAGAYATPMTASGGVSYKWSVTGQPTAATGLYTSTAASTAATTATAITNTTYVLPTVQSSYTVTVTDGNGCTATGTKTVNVVNNLTSVISGDTIACTLSTIHLKDSANMTYGVKSYIIGASSATYTPISGGTTLSLSDLNDGGVGNLPIGFTLPYRALTYTTFSANANGYLVLGDNQANYGSTPTNSLTAVVNYIAPFWDDNNITGGSISYVTTGTAPNRVLTVQWTGLHIGGTGSATQPTLDMQAKLFETTGQILFAYGNTSATLTSTTATVGISGGSGAYYNLSGTGAAPTASSSTPYNSLSVAPAPNQVYTFTPYIPTYKYTWNTPTINTTLSPLVDSNLVCNPTISSFAGAEKFTVTILEKSSGCVKVDTIWVKGSLGLLSDSITNSKPAYCTGDSSLLKVYPIAGCMPYSYVWNDGSTNFSTNQSFYAKPTATTTYTVTVTDGSGATATATTTVTVNPYPTTGITSSATTYCGYGSIRLDGTGATTYKWYPTTNLYTDSACSTAYVINTLASVVYSKPVANVTYTDTGFFASGCKLKYGGMTITYGGKIATTISATAPSACTGSLDTLNTSMTYTNTLTQYQTSVGSGATLDPMTGDTVLIASGQNNVDNASGVAINFPAGFLFPYEGVNQTSFGVSDNGLLRFGGLPGITTYNNITTTAKTISAYGTNQTTGSDGKVSYLVSGTTPNRILKVQYKTNSLADGIAAPANNIYQIWLHEGTGNIDLVYGAVTTLTSNFSIGASGLSSGTNFISVWTTPNPDTISVVGVTNLNTSFPTSGTIYSFKPGLTYTWTSLNGLNTIDTTNNPIAVATINATGGYELLITAPSGCTKDTVINLALGGGVVSDTLSAFPAASVAVPVCPNTTITISNTGLSGGCSPFSYAWSTGATTANLVIAATTTQTYTVTVTDNAGATVAASYIVNVLPAINPVISPNTVANCGTTAPSLMKATPAGLTYKWSVTGSPSTYTYLYYAPSSSSAYSGTNQDSVYVIVNSTSVVGRSYTVTITDANACTATASKFVNIQNVMVDYLTVDNDTACAGTTINLKDSAFVGYGVIGYVFSKSAGTYTPITGGTAVAITDSNKGGVGNLPIGFNALFGANSYKSVFSVNPDGYLIWGDATPTYTSIDNASGYLSNVIAPFWDDNNITGGSMSYVTTGTAPNRVLTVQWAGLHIGGAGNASQPTMDMQVKLYETTGQIQFIYGNVSGAFSSTSAYIGIEGGTSKYQCLTNASATALATATYTGTISAAPINGQTFTFTPPIPNFYYTWKTPSINNGLTPLTGTGSWANPFTSAIPALAGSETLYLTIVDSTSGCSKKDSISLVKNNISQLVYLVPSTKSACQEQCLDSNWTYYSDPSNAKKWVFGIYKNGNTFTPTVDITLSAGAIDSSTNIKSSKAAMMMKRSWNVNSGTITGSNPMKIRFFYDPAELSDLQSAATAWAAAHPDTIPGYTTKVHAIEWFKTVGSQYSASNMQPNGTHTGSGPLIKYSPIFGTINGVNYMQYEGITSFSGGSSAIQIYPSPNSPVPLPVKLVSFTAEAISNSFIKTAWVTATEINNKGFFVERSEDGVHFKELGWVDGNGNTTEMKTYSWNDKKAVAGIEYYYRLRQMDLDGTFNYSEMASAELKIEGALGVNLYPIPAKNQLNVALSTLLNSPITIQIYNALGEKIHTEQFNGAGTEIKTFDLSNLSSGNYLISIQSNTDKVTRKFTVVK